MSKNVNLSWEIFREKINVKMQTTRIWSDFAIILEKRKKLLKKKKIVTIEQGQLEIANFAIVTFFFGINDIETGFA